MHLSNSITKNTSRPDVSGIEPVLFGCVFAELILANRVCLTWLSYFFNYYSCLA